MQEALQAVLQPDEHAEVGDLRDGALHDVARLVPLRNVRRPRIVGHLLESKGDPPTLLVDREHLALDLVALVEHFAGVRHLPRP